MATKAKLMTTKLKMTAGSGNVFRDIGFPEGEAENLLLRSELMSQVREVARGYTQQEAAKMLGITQPRLNQLLKGKISLFSLDALVNMLAKAGMRVSMKVKKAACEATSPMPKSAPGPRPDIHKRWAALVFRQDSCR